MNFVQAFLRQQSPKSGTQKPAYYRKALTVSAIILAVYFPLCFLAMRWASGQWEIMPAALFVATLLYLPNVSRMPARIGLLAHTASTLVWACWFVSRYGWSCGAQHFLVPMVLMVFFNIYEPPWGKIAYLAAMVAVRMGLFSWSLDHPATREIGRMGMVVLQDLNTLAVFLIMACACILFSTSVQATERQLRLDNQELHKEAGTDPLTQLPNRRAMLDELSLFLKKEPETPFCVAIADIDFFKNVNDTYGHNCGDYTLRTLSDKFREAAQGDYRVCRWGGEEFCFFLPGQNIDDAGKKMIDLCMDVSRMPLSFEGNDFNITITIGVEEYDFRSPIDDILERADQKLYMGKNSGRNQAVV